jgi:hypothetical protein
MAALYTFTNFQGLRDARAMEEAQLARNFAQQGRLVTQCVRPFISAGWRSGRRTAPPRRWTSRTCCIRRCGRRSWPEPSTWSGCRNPASDDAYVNGMDYLPVATSHFFTALAAILVWLLGCKLFDHRVGVLAASSFLLSDLAWRWSLLGSDLAAATFFALAAVYAGVWAAERPWARGRRPERGASRAGWCRWCWRRCRPRRRF